MALPSSGPISISKIKAELTSSVNSLRTLSNSVGYSTPDAISEFYGYSSIYTIKYGLAPNAFDGARNAIKLSNGGIGIANATWLKTSSTQVTSKNIVILNNRLNYDFTFNSNDTGAGSTGTPYCIAQLTDGGYVVGGNIVNYNGVSSTYIYKANANGTRDTGFVAGGKLNGTVTDLVALPDGKFIAIGDFTDYNGTFVPKICRLNADGTLDSSFNGAGSGFNARPKSIVRLSTGDFIVIGDFSSYNGNSVGRIVKIGSNGAIDSTFRTNSGTGFTGAGANSGDMGSARLALAYDDKVYATGWFTSYNGTARDLPPRINTNGTLDTTFANSTGYSLNSFGSAFMATVPNGKVIYSGLDSSMTYGNWKTSLLNENGSLSTNLSTQDLATVVVKSNTEFVMLGLSSWKGTAVPNIALVDDAGTLKSTYANYP